VAQRLPGLRQAYMPLPFPHIYQHPHSVCALVVEREWQGEPVLVAGRVREPEALSLKEIGERIRALRETPVQEVAEFRQVLRLGRMPRIIRRLALSYALYLGGGFRRAKRLGTFMVSSYGTLGAEQLHPLTPLTTLLTFGPISAEGEVNVKMVYDHRILDGRYIARGLAELEQVLNHELAHELVTGKRLAA